MAENVMLIPADYGGISGLNGALKNWNAAGYRVLSVGYNTEGLPIVVFLEKD